MPTSSARILLATDNADDAQLIRNLLRDEFTNVGVAGEVEQGVAEFEQQPPAVLMLAFDTLEKAERYYLGIYRLGAAVQTAPHRTVILCNKDNLRQVYTLCRQGTFDDYVLFWPMSHDATRLLLAVHQALRYNAAIASASARPSSGEIANQVRSLGGFDTQLEGHAASGRQHVESIGHSLQQANRAIDATLEHFAHRLATAPGEAGSEARAQMARELQRLKSDDIAQHFRSVTASLQPALRWTSDLQQDIAAQAQAARSLKETAERVRRLVLVVDDDEFQRKLLERLLGDAGYETVGAASAIHALAAVARRRPDLVLMDVELPDFDGVEATRRIKAVDGQAAIPVLMITGHSNKDVILASVMAGSAGFLVKPFDRAVLLDKVARTLDH